MTGTRAELDDLVSMMKGLAKKENLLAALALREGPLGRQELAARIGDSEGGVAKAVKALIRAGIVSPRRRGTQAVFVLDCPAVILRILHAIERDPRGWR